MILLTAPVKAEDESKTVYSVRHGFYQQLVVDLAIDTLQKLSPPLSTPSEFSVLGEKLKDIRQGVWAMGASGAAENEHAATVMTQLDHLYEIIRFHQLPAEKKPATSLTLKTQYHIDGLLAYLRKQPNISGFLADSSLLDLTANREAKFDGRWELIDTVKGGALNGLSISFQVQIKGNDVTFEASGEKIRENDVEISAKHRSPLKIYGYIKNNVIRAAFSEQGLRNESSGEFVWLILNDRLLSGTFRSSTGATGDSILVKVEE